ncbi:MAG: phosphatase PAP2 family protein [Legionellaceae bacterium]
MKTLVDALFKWSIKPWVMAMVVLIVTGCFLYVDKPLAYLLHGYSEPVLPLVLGVFTHLGDNKIYLVGLFLLTLIFQYFFRKEQYARNTLFLWACVLFPSIICFVLKVCFGRARSCLLFDDQAYGFYGFQMNQAYWSFPSGHTTTIMGMALGLCVLFPRYRLAFLLAGLLVILSRVVLLEHYLSDVFMASYLAVLEIGFLVFIFRRRGLLVGEA